MPRRRRWLPRASRPDRRVQRATPYGAVGIAVAAGFRAAPPHPENYAGPYGAPGPQVYSEAPRPPEPYPGSYGSPGPQVYSGREAPPPPDPSSGPYAPQVSGPYAPQVYSGPTGRMRWMIGPQPYGM